MRLCGERLLSANFINHLRAWFMIESFPYFGETVHVIAAIASP